MGTPAHRDEAWRVAVDADPRFAPLGTVESPNEQLADRTLLTERVASISFVAALPEADRGALLTDVRRLADELGLPDRFPLRYVTEVHITHVG